jgi:ribosome-associated translation inhibitor RaiA
VILVPLIEQILQDLPPDQRQICFTFDHRHDGYTGEATLRLAGETIVVRIEPPVTDHRAAVDQLVNKLAEEIRRHERRPA